MLLDMFEEGELSIKVVLLMAHKVKFHAYNRMYLYGKPYGRVFLAGAGVDKKKLVRETKYSNTVWNRKVGKGKYEVVFVDVKKVKVPSRAGGMSGFPKYNLKY